MDEEYRIDLKNLVFKELVSKDVVSVAMALN